MKSVVAMLVLSCLLASCGQRESDKERAQPIRIPLAVAATASASAIGPMAQSMPSVWTSTPPARQASYGQPNAPALISIACEGAEQRASRLVIVRYVPADKGAEALFAIQGSKGILRLPVSAVEIGARGYVWRGVLDAADPRVEVLLGAGLKATVPGGGEVLLAPMGATGVVVSECVAAAAKPAASAQTLPNLASNPEISPADR